MNATVTQIKCRIRNTPAVTGNIAMGVEKRQENSEITILNLRGQNEIARERKENIGRRRKLEKGTSESNGRKGRCAMLTWNMSYPYELTDGNCSTTGKITLDKSRGWLKLGQSIPRNL